jgi:hypothetical protein
MVGGAEPAALLAVPGDAVAFEVGDVGRQRRRAEGAPLMPDHPGLGFLRRIVTGFEKILRRKILDGNSPF